MSKVILTFLKNVNYYPTCIATIVAHLPHPGKKVF